MDSVTIIIGAIVIALCTIPFVFMAQKRKKEETQIIGSLTEMAEKENCKITRHKLFGDSVIGLDEINNYIFFFKKVEDGNMKTEQFVKLADIQSCKLVNTSRSVEGNDKVIVVDKLELSFLFKDRNKQKTLFEFFNTDKSMQLNGELQIATEWEEIVNSRLKLINSKK